MDNVFFTSDLHFGHANVIRYDGRPFSSANEMDEKMIELWNQTVKRGDTVYVLGDISWHNKDRTLEITKRLNGNKVLIRGNHDRLRGNAYDAFVDVRDYKEINLDGRHITLCHYPIPYFNMQRYHAVMLYGHVHNTEEWAAVNRIRDGIIDKGVPCDLFNVGCMIWDYKPVTLDEILEKRK